MDRACHAIVLSIDEKSLIQAVDRTQPDPPLKLGNAQPRPTTTSATVPPPGSPL
jgi:hypothetical protein